jgi:hypothetical protein
MAQAEIERERNSWLRTRQMEAMRAAAEMSDGRERETIKIGVDLAKQLSAQHHQKEMQKPKKGNE